MRRPRRHGWSAPLVGAAALLVLLAGPARAQDGEDEGGESVMQIPATLVIDSTTSGATVELDGEKIGELPLEGGTAVEPGEHTIRITKPGYMEHIDNFEAEPGSTVTLDVSLIPVAGIVEISSPKEGATVEIDGEVAGSTPYEDDVNAGERTIVVKRPGHEPAERKMKIVAGEHYDLTMKPEPIPGATGGEERSVARSWWLWTIVGVAAGGAAAAGAVAGGDDGPPQPDTTIRID